jgi:ABC-type phosphate transport system substrate-binding protein
MGIQKPMRRLALMVACACAGLAMFGLATAGSALAVPCESTTGSGSTLQNSMQQEVWTKAANNTKFLSSGSKACNKPIAEVKYNAGGAGTGSGQGLEEWGFADEALHPTLSANGAKLDGYIGSDVPPSTKEEQKAGVAGGTTIETVPVLDAPVAMLIHPPAACKVTSTKFTVTNLQWDKLWLGESGSWEAFLKAIGGSFTGTCTAEIIHEVRSDGSGTSFAFKQYLSHIQTKPWSSFVSSADEWPTKTMASKEHPEGATKVPNKGGKGESMAVALAEGSIGYANAADSQGSGFGPYAKGTKIFWASVQDNGTVEAGAKFAEPTVVEENEAGQKTGNCPGVLPEGFASPAKAEQPNWSNVQQAFPKVAEKTYSICTLTYDEFWGKYTTEQLKGVNNYNSLGESVGNTMRRYCEFMVGTEGQEDLKTKIQNYSPLPAEVDTRAAETCKGFVATS